MDHMVVFEGNNPHQSQELRLVLLAAGIPAEVSRSHLGWQVIVPEARYREAHRELQDYEDDLLLSRENSDADSSADASSRALDNPGGLIGTLGFAITLLAVWFIDAGLGLSESLMSNGSSQAGKIVDGEWYRIFTALTLHVDAVHLLSNLVFGCLFGFLVTQLLGGGMGWLLILVAGAAGNYANAALREVSHLSIGASTAVFGALGIAVMHALVPSLKKERGALRRWTPLIGGVLLLALLGTGGERTDVGAHATGFIAGLVIGASSRIIPDKYIDDSRVQCGAGILTVVLLATAWALAIQS